MNVNKQFQPISENIHCMQVVKILEIVIQKAARMITLCMTSQIFSQQNFTKGSIYSRLRDLALEL